MKPSVFPIVLVASAVFGQPPAVPIRSAVKAVSCSLKTGAEPEQEFCTAVSKMLATHRVRQVAANRSLPLTTIEFSARSLETSVTASVLVTDPIGKNTVKLIFSVPVSPPVAAQRSLDSLDWLLQIPATRKNAGWITVMPKGAGARKQ